MVLNNVNQLSDLTRPVKQLESDSHKPIIFKQEVLTDRRDLTAFRRQYQPAKMKRDKQACVLQFSNGKRKNIMFHFIFLW